MNINKQDISNHNYKYDFESLINGIDDDDIKKIYKQFEFQHICFENEENKTESWLTKFLADFKFITYQIPENTNDINNSNSINCDILICAEETFLIINSIKISKINQLFDKSESSIINVHPNEDEITQEQTDINGEIKSFYEKYHQLIDNNEFVKFTIRPIIAYIIRRFYYPSNFFKNPSFFTFNTNKNESFIQFKKNEFIFLRTISQTDKTFFLVLHVKTLFLFCLQQIYDIEESTYNRLIEFFKNNSHRCLTKCYGFINEKDKHFTYFIYEFMSKGSLTYEKVSNINFFYSNIIMNRLFQAINFLHSKNYVHRDIKPSNILINHDNVPFLSDFEFIRQLDGNGLMTKDFGSYFFASPEQISNENGKVSFPTDIYSFGKTIYLLFEKEIMFKNLDFEQIKQMKNSLCPNMSNTPNFVQNIIRNSIKYSPKDRLQINDIHKILSDSVKTLYFLEPDFLTANVYDTNKEELDLFFSEEIQIISDNDPNKNKIETILNLLKQEKNLSSVLNRLGLIYKEGNIDEVNYLKARQAFKLSIKVSNSKNSFALINMGFLYMDGLGVEKNPKKALKYYNMCAQLNDPMGFLNIGNMYFNGFGVDQSYLKAKEYYEKAANLNYAGAYNRLGLLYLHGNGVDKDDYKALEYFTLSAQLNNSYGLLFLGNLYRNGPNDIKNPEKVIECYEKAAKLNNTGGLNSLGLLYLKGEIVEKNYKKAIELFKESAALNNSNAMNFLGDIYLNGYGCTRNYQKAKEYFEMVVKKGNSNGYIKLGNLYLFGYGVKRDYQKVREYYEIAAKQNNSDSLIGLGFLYLMGLGVKKDYKKAKHYFDLSASQSNPEAFICIGNLYLKGYGCEKNITEVIKNYELAAEKGSSNAYNYLGKLYNESYEIPHDFTKAKYCFEKGTQKNNANSFIQLANLYLKDNGVKQDNIVLRKNKEKALEYYRIAAKQDNFDANYNLGKLYLLGVDVEKDYKKAREYFELSAVSNHLDSYFYLGKIYYEGLGLSKDYAKAREFFEIASEHFSLQSYFFLGKIYEQGKGVEKDINKAIEYYKICAENHDETFIYYYYNGWKEFSQKNEYYYLANNSLGVIYITDPNLQNLKLAEEYLKIPGLNENFIGQNNFGLINQFYLENMDKAKLMYESASKNQYALSEFNLGYLEETKKNHSKSIEHYQKAYEYDCEQIINDDQLEISQIFIICLASLKLAYNCFNDDEIANKIFMINAIFRPIFKLLFNDGCDSYLFNFEIKEVQNNCVITNLREFFLHFPLVNICNEIDQSNSLLNSWKKSNQNSDNKTVTFLFKTKTKDKHQNQNSKSKDKIFTEKSKTTHENTNTLVENEIVNIFDFYNKQNIYEQIHINNNEIETSMSEFRFKKHDESNEKIIRYPKYFGEILNSSAILEKKDIANIINDMSSILYLYPYQILFGRIQINEPNPPKKIPYINDQFYNGLDLNI